MTWKLSHFVLILCAVLCSVSGNSGIPKKLRRYKVCNGSKCKVLASSHNGNNPPSFIQEIDSFLYTHWTRWGKCNRHCTTKRNRSCKFPLICGNTVIKEEAFCYHRRSHCETIYENNRRDYQSNDYGSNDYQEGLDYGHYSHEKGLQLPHHLSSNTLEKSVNRWWNWDNTAAASRNSNSFNRRTPPDHFLPQADDNRFRRNHHNETRLDYPASHTPTRTTITTTEGPRRDHPHRHNHNQEDKATCGVARITDRNRNGLALRILGGEESKLGRWPWQVAVLNKMNEAFCGGTLIAPRWILTAAHCIRNKLVVTVGEHHLHRNEGTEKQYKIEAAFIHPDFDQDTVDNDIALLLLPEPVPTEAGLACLPESEYHQLPPAGTMCTILGWGKERHTHVFGTTVLHEGRVPLVSNGECRFTYGPQEITNNMFCAGYKGGTVDSCAGDSGGPILCSEHSRWTVFGVTSFGDGCGRQGKYGIYAKVPNYVAWIKKVMKANDYGY